MASMNKPIAGDTDWATEINDNWTSIENNLIDKSIVTTKGDIIAASAASTPVRVAVGSNEQALIADSAQAAGVKWGTLPIAGGGTGATTAAAARTALDVPSNAEAVLDTIIDAKGDLIVGTAADTPARLAVGSNDQALIADSAQGAGVKWGTLTIAGGGTGATTAAGARSALDVPSTTEAILDTIIDAKGDLIVGTAADTPARLAIGSDGQVLTADSAQGSGMKWASVASPTTKRKTADESVTSSTALQDDDHLTLAVGANEEYVGTFEIFAGDLLTTTGCKVAIQAPTGSTLRVSAAKLDNAAFVYQKQTTTSDGALDFTTAETVSTTALFRLSVWVLVGGNSGSIKLRWAQSTSSGTALTFKRGSFMTMTKVN